MFFKFNNFKSFLKSTLVVSLMVVPMYACSNAVINNPFLPKAELTITDVSGSGGTGGAGIYQTFQMQGEILSAKYRFVDPSISLENKPGLPRVIFKQIVVQHTIGDKKLPPVTYPVTITIPRGGNFSGSIPVFSSSNELIYAIFPNDSFASLPSGFSEATLLGLDDNGYLVSVKFSTPAHFETDASGYKPVVVATPTPAAATPRVVALK